MPSKDEKARRKELLQSLRNEGRQKTRDGFPVPLLMLKGLFDSLDVKLSETDCGDTPFALPGSSFSGTPLTKNNWSSPGLKSTEGAATARH